MKTDTEIQKAIKNELEWDPSINNERIDVTVKSRIVTLSGVVDSYSKKLAAERKAARLAGVKAVTNDIKVKIGPSFKRSDFDIERAVLTAVKWNSSVDENRIKARVTDGWVILEGEVDWEYQKSRVKNLAEDLTGVIGVTNLITVIPAMDSLLKEKEVKEKINAAFQRDYYLDADKINVEVNGSKVTLTGDVRTLAEKKDAENAAWSAPGIKEVVNRLEVNYIEAFA